MKLQAQAAQLVENFRIRYQPQDMDLGKLRGIVFLGLKEGIPGEAIARALPTMRVVSMSALKACTDMVERGSVQPSEQRRRRPAEWVPSIPVERSDEEREAAQQSFADMRALIRPTVRDGTTRHQQVSTEPAPAPPHPGGDPPPPPPGWGSRPT